MLYTDNIGLKKPAYNEPADIADINENMDTIDREFGNRYLKFETYSVEQANNAIAQAIEALPNGLVYRGAVNYYKDLPTGNNELGDTYSVKYQGETGTTADGNEYAWGEYDGTLQWIKLGVNAYTKDEIDEQHETIKSDISSAENGIAVNRHTLGTQCKNIFDILSFQNVTKTATRATVENVENGIKITANVVDSLGKKGDAYTNSYDKSNNHYKIPVNPNTKYIISWNADNNNSGRNYVFFNGVTDNNKMGDNSSVKNFQFTTPFNTTFITVRFGVTEYETSITYTNIMIRPADITDDTYEPYNPTLQEQINALVERIQALETAQITTVSE